MSTSKTAERFKAHTWSLNNTVGLCAETRACWLTQDQGNQLVTHSTFHCKNHAKLQNLGFRKCWILKGKQLGLSFLNNPHHHKFTLRNICRYLHPISCSLAILQKTSAPLTIMMMNSFSIAFLQNLSTHVQASPISDLYQSRPSLAEPIHPLMHYGNVTQTLNILTRLSFFKNCIQFSIHAICYHLPEFSVSF